MYNFIKTLEKIINILEKIILFIPMCISIPISFLFDKYEKYKIKKGYSIRIIKRYIKYCDDYYKDKYHEDLFVLDNFYTEFDNCLNINKFVNNITPYFIRDKIRKIYYSKSHEKFIEELNEYYGSRLLTEEELKQEFTREDGSVSYWYDSIKDKKVVKF